MKIIFLGPPGSGKGTYSSRICSQKGWAHIATGDILREEIKNDTGLGRKANEFMKKGSLVPDGLVIDMLRKRMENRDCRKGFILDGFPRTTEQARALEDISPIDVVINLSIPDEILIQKISARRTCSKCGDVYNLADIKFGENNQCHMPPVLPKNEGVCDKCNSPLVQRKDDTDGVIRERLNVYKKQTEPLIQYYREKGILKDVPVVGPPEMMVTKIMGIMESV